MIRYSTLSVSREVQIKTTMRYHYTAISTAITKKSNNWQVCGATGTAAGNAKGQSHVDIHLPDDPVSSLLNVDPREMQTYVHTKFIRSA